MIIKKFAYLIALFCLSYAANAFADPLSPQTPVIVVNTNGVRTSPIVSGTNAGFIIACVDDTNSLDTSFSSDGNTWGTPVITALDAFTAPWLSGTTAGFMTTFIRPAPGFTTAAPYSSFSSDNGTTWNTEVLILNSNNIATPTVVCGTSAGFMATWNDSNDDNAYSSFSVNNGDTWSTPVQITTSGLVFGNDNHFSAVITTSTPYGVVATWLQTDTNGYASFSNDNGSTWSTPVQITNTGDLASDVFVSNNNSTGVMATWVNASGVAFSSFSNDGGSTWGAPVQIATDLVINNLSSGVGSDVAVSGTTAGFVATWIGQDNNAYGSFSGPNGTSWSTPVAITTDASVSFENNDFAFGYVSVFTLGNSCIFTWQDTNNNVLASFSSIGSPSAPRSFVRPSTRRPGS